MSQGDRTPLIAGASVVGIAALGLVAALWMRSGAQEARPAKAPRAAEQEASKPPPREAEPPKPKEPPPKPPDPDPVPADPPAAIEEASRLADFGQFREALEKIDRALQEFPAAREKLQAERDEIAQLALAAFEEARDKADPGRLRAYAQHAPDDLAEKARKLATEIEDTARKDELVKRISAAEILATQGKLDEAADALDEAAALPGADAPKLRARAAGWRRMAWYAGALPPEALATTDPETIGAVEAEVRAFLAAATPDAVNDAFRRLTALPRVTPDLVAAVILRDGPFEEFAEGDTTYEFALPDGQKRKLVLSVPRGYTPKQRWPLFVHLHGTHGTIEMCEGSADYYRALSAGRYLVAQPAAARSSGWGPMKVGEQQIPAALRFVRTKFPVDPDRVWLAGVSMGAHGTWHQAMRHGDLYACYLPRSGSPYGGYGPNWEAYLDNLRLGTSYFVHGAKDGMFPIGTVREFAGKAEKMKLAVDYHEFRDSGHEGAPEAELRKGFEWMTTQVRDPYPRSFAWTTDHEEFGRFSWVEATAFPKDAARDNAQFKDNAGKIAEQRAILHVPARFAVAVEGQTVKITAKGISKMRVYWTPRVLDLSKEVVVKVNGRQAWKGTPEVSVRKMLEEARGTGRRDVVFYGVVEVNVP
ncbi:MAG: hypothetical protein HYY18_04380 [Planctomycetes bacterium]|nr:hypothetical protein [Planctomycetota bacterium]